MVNSETQKAIMALYRAQSVLYAPCGSLQRQARRCACHHGRRRPRRMQSGRCRRICPPARVYPAYEWEKLVSEKCTIEIVARASKRAYFHATARAFIGSNSSIAYCTPTGGSGLSDRRSSRVRGRGVGRHDLKARQVSTELPKGVIRPRLQKSVGRPNSSVAELSDLGRRRFYNKRIVQVTRVCAQRSLGRVITGPLATGGRRS